MIEFWTFGCYNCKNVEPQIKQWHDAYHHQGLIIIGIHTPEFSHEKNVQNVKRYIQENKIVYPIAIDNDFINWKRFKNRYWPTLYLIDKRGVIRYVRIGEGGYAHTRKMIETLLKE